MSIPIHKIRNDMGSLRSQLMGEAAYRPLLQVQLSANFRSSNYSATQNFVNVADLTEAMVAGDAQAGA